MCGAKRTYMRYEYSTRINNPQAGRKYITLTLPKDNTLLLPSGVQIPFRGVRPDDAPALQRLHARCSERTIYLRFFGLMKELSDEKVRYFASTDGADHFGLVALDPEDPNEIIAVVRYARKSGDERAEYAALVEARREREGG